MDTTKPFISIYIESNPNPNSLKFVLNQMLFAEGESHDFPNPEAATHAPLAKKLLELEFVDRVFYMNNFITVTKNDMVEWEEVKFQVRDLIKDFIESGQNLLDQVDTIHHDEQEETPQIQQIKMILDEYIKPAVEQDGGAITFQSFHDGLLKVNLQGACSGCPSSTVTLKAGIENLMKRMVPEVKAVEAEGV